MQLVTAYSLWWVSSTVTVPSQGYNDSGVKGTGDGFVTGTYEVIQSSFTPGAGTVWEGDPRSAWALGTETSPAQGYNDSDVLGTGAPFVAGDSFAAAYTFVNSGSVGYACNVSAGVNSSIGASAAVQIGLGLTEVVTPAVGLGTVPAAVVEAGQFVSTNGPIFGTGVAPAVMLNLGDTVPAGALTAAGVAPSPVVAYGCSVSAAPLSAFGSAAAVQVQTGCTAFAGPLSATSVVPAVTLNYGDVLWGGYNRSTGVVPSPVIGTGWTVPVTPGSAAGSVPNVNVLVVVPVFPLSSTGTIPSPLLLTRSTLCTLNLLGDAAPTGQGLLDLYTLIMRANWKVLVTGAAWVEAGAVDAVGTAPQPTVPV
jgi:hypothetical protein